MLHAGGIRARLRTARVSTTGSRTTSSLHAGRKPGAADARLQRPRLPLHDQLPDARDADVRLLPPQWQPVIGMTPDGRNAATATQEVNQALEAFRRETDADRLTAQFGRDRAPNGAQGLRHTDAAARSPRFQPHGRCPNLGIYRGWPAGSPVTETALHHWTTHRSRRCARSRPRAKKFLRRPDRQLVHRSRRSRSSDSSLTNRRVVRERPANAYMLRRPLRLFGQYC